MMNVDTLEIENFWSYRSATLQFNYSGPVLVHGDVKNSLYTDSNGAGKSSVFEALIWVLFGKTTTGVSADSVVNSSIGKNCRVKLSGSCSSGPFTIVRFRKHEDYENKLLFFLNNVDVSSLDNKKTQAKIQSTLQVDYDSFIATTFFSSKTSSGFCSLTDANQKNIINKILDLDKWSTAHSIARDKLSEAKTKVTTLTAEIRAYEHTKKSLIEDIEQYREENSTKIKLLARQVKKKTKLVRKMLVSLKACTDDLNTCLVDSPSQLEQRVELEKNLIVSVDKQILVKEQDLRAAKESLSNVQRGTCDACGQRLPQVTAAIVDQLHSSILKTEAEIRELTASKNLSYSNLLNVSSVIEDAKKKIETRRSTIDKLLMLANAEQSVAASVANYKTTLRDKRKAVKRIQKLIDGATALADQYNKTVSILSDVSVATGLKGVRALCIKTVLPIVNSSLVKYCSVVTSGELLAQLNMESDRITVSVSKPGGQGYNSCSAGEARRVDICVLFSLLDLIECVGKKANFLILDEVFDHLDHTGLDKAMSLLYNVNQKNIFVISHSRELKEFFQKDVSVQKINGESKISTE